ncbi:MAG: hypothetical protein B7C24_15940 [Bacteroidetes bacterium 4572_77]|nr:MAG: hypothetical protein B7C24_15940 [Bacteroidetes bacterium 4572_77]
MNNVSFLVPNGNQDLKYLMRIYAFELARLFSKNTVVIAGLKVNNGGKNNGDHVSDLTYAFGFYYNFNCPVS